MAAQTRGKKGWLFLAVGRVKDSVTLASYSSTESIQQGEHIEKECFKKILAAAHRKLQAGMRMRMLWNKCAVMRWMDNKGELLYCVVTSSWDYPEQKAYELLKELMSHVTIGDALGAAEHGLMDALTDPMEELINKYEDGEDGPRKVITLHPEMRDGMLVITCTSVAGDVVTVFDSLDVISMTLRQLISQLKTCTGYEQALQLIRADGRVLSRSDKGKTLSDLFVEDVSPS
eukprot:TRINITY_DN64732_c0_g1_i1.p1 TRINITY_DN64732_c0_g1~~TRINITY_DN64732_c0_g1_i1.p1  ORF type:complete len:240 (-),score=35.95 TRINITY_DN64732_c0_g1_i1:275-967(-)